LQSTANVRRLSAWLTESMSRVHICENYYEQIRRILPSHPLQ
jgi:hypothetical protein